MKNIVIRIGVVVILAITSLPIDGKLYKHILQHIKKSVHSPNFNIGISTGAQTKRDYWEMPYRHWCFVPKEFREDPSKYKK